MAGALTHNSTLQWQETSDLEVMRSFLCSGEELSLVTMATSTHQNLMMLQNNYLQSKVEKRNSKSIMEIIMWKAALMAHQWESLSEHHKPITQPELLKIAPEEVSAWDF